MDWTSLDTVAEDLMVKETSLTNSVEDGKEMSTLLEVLVREVIVVETSLPISILESILLSMATVV